MAFIELLQTAINHNRSTLCIGLDPDLKRFPEGISRDADGIVAFNRAIIEATSHLVCAYKPNSAFYEALGAAGWHALKATIAAVPQHIPVILDAKRGDIGSTAQAYAEAAFDDLNAHAITLNPYLGTDALEPFLQYPDRGCFLLCRTSNPGGADLQTLALADGTPLYLRVARLANERWNTQGSVGLVVGATVPEELALVHETAPELPLLVPGVGAQGGDVATVAKIAGRQAIINVSRAILYASDGGDWLAAAHRTAQEFQAQTALHSRL